MARAECRRCGNEITDALHPEYVAEPDGWMHVDFPAGCPEGPGVTGGKSTSALATAAQRALDAIESDGLAEPDIGDEYGNALDALAEALAGFDPDGVSSDGVLDAIHAAVLANESAADQLQAIYALLETTGRKVP